jgi:hypothetical protein
MFYEIEHDPVPTGSPTGIPRLVSGPKCEIPYPAPTNRGDHKKSKINT